MRPDPGTPPPVPNVRGQAPAGKIRQIRRYELITPLFGGGVEPQQADPVTVVRGSEIRGQLRFWWRACRGGRFDGSLQKMKEAEDLLWGAPASKDKPLESKVVIALTIVNAGKPFAIIDRDGKTISLGHFRSPYSYVAFPMQQNPDAVVMEGVVFDLDIMYPQEYKHDVEAALWAWQTFGGIGGRTRRGFGALCCTQVGDKAEELPTVEGLRAEILKHLNTPEIVSKGTFPAGVPHLTPEAQWFRTTRGMGKPMDAWLHLIERLKKFRQDRNQGMQSNRPGRSRWPEPDAIRHRFGDRRWTHQPRPDGADKFPRAAFGLPIVFHFKDRDDPPETRLEGLNAKEKVLGRLASPLILRPVRCKNGAVGIGLVLQGCRRPPGGWTLHNAPRSGGIAVDLAQAEARAIPVLNGEPDVLAAFLNYLVA